MLKIEWTESGSGRVEPRFIEAEKSWNQWVFRSRYFSEIRWFSEPATALLISQANNILLRKQIDERDTPLPRYIVESSHRSYVMCNQEHHG